ncbi:MAG: hypothetical protein JWO90_1110, partial [Solirubrobacterales bacterium]|nr:hypothetical protein [Solirubrobacterales bacterium]
MAGSSDFPLDPETGSVVDPDVLEARRARRAEQVEDDPVERGRRAERMVSALELRLAQAEGRLAAAERERAEVEGALARAENALTAARQREFSEQRRREEVESDAAGEVRALQEHVARLRAENERAAVRAAELSQA